MAITSVHVAVFPFPFSSHPGSLYKLTKRLASSAPTVEFTFFNTHKSNDALFSKQTDIPPNIKAFNVWDGIPLQAAGDGLNKKGGTPPEAEIGLYMENAPDTLRKAVVEAESKSGKKVTCMLSDPFMWFVVEMAEEMNVPWVTAYPSGVQSLATHFYTDAIREKLKMIIGTDHINHLDLDDERIRNLGGDILSFIPDFQDFRVHDLPGGVLSGDLESFFPKMLHNAGRVLPRAAAVLVNCVEELHPELTADLKSKLKRFLCIGPFNLTIPNPRPTPDPHSCISWLDRQPPQSVLYIGFGTVLRPSPQETAAIAGAIQDGSIRFLWSINTDQMTKDLPASFVDWARDSGRGKLVPWAPQVEVLEHAAVAASVTHFGWNSVLECLAAGVLMIGRPFFGDHPVNSRLSEATWGVGVTAADPGGILTKVGMTRALERVMVVEGKDDEHEEERRRMRENAARLKVLLKVAAGPGGTSSVNFDTAAKIATSTEFQRCQS